MTIEDDVTGGVATWLDGFRYDRAAGTVEFQTVVPNERTAPVRRVKFTRVRDYAEEPFDSAAPCEANVLECLVGLDSHARGPTVWYVIHTTERESTFYADTPPQIDLLGAGPEGESGSPAA